MSMDRPFADVCSYGGGVQSTALLALAALGRFDCNTFLFANVGDDSEHPDSLAYVEQFARPFAEAHDIELVELRRTAKDGSQPTLHDDITKPRRSLTIPVYLYPSGMPASRACTNHWKIKVVNDEMRDRGATADDPRSVALGISVDEIERAKPGIDPKDPFRERVYPLLDLGMHRFPDCHDVITEAGLPIPRKSACYFCPYTPDTGWRDLRERFPHLWEDTVEIERATNKRRAEAGKNPLYFSRHLVPLNEAVDDQLSFDGMGNDCDSGFCFT